MISIAVCDDEEIYSTKIDNLLTEYSQKNEVRINIEIFGDGKDLVNYINNGYSYDLIFLDIEMNYLNGLDAAREIRKIDKNCLIIYVTNYSGYAIEAYEVRPFQFLLKPFSDDQFYKYFTLALNEISNDEYYFRFIAKRESYRLAIKDILYFESKGRTIYIHTNSDKEYKYNNKLKNIEDEFISKNIEFWRIHQSYLVNRRLIHTIGYTKIELINGEVLPISEDRRKQIREKYLDKIGAGLIEY